jgi:protein O-mannosyl-transferase
MVCAVAAVVYLGALRNGFAYDDLVLIAGDPGIRSWAGLIERLGAPSWPSGFGDLVGAWRPLTTGMWALTWIASGGSVIAFHALAILLHVWVAGVVTVLFMELLPAGASFVGGLVFAVHPVHVEAVANIAGSAETLSAGLALTALVVHLRGRDSYRLGRALAVTALFAAAVLAKEGAAVLPALILLLDAARRRMDLRGTLRYVRERGPLYLLLSVALALVLVFRAGVLGALARSTYPPGAEALVAGPRSWTVFGAWPEYFRLLFIPWKLSADYAPRVVPVVFAWTPAALLGVALALVTMAFSLALWRRSGGWDADAMGQRVLALSPLWVGVALLPVANVLYLGPVLVAERTLYLPSVGFAAAAGYLLTLIPRPRLRVAVVFTVVLLGAARTAARVPAWRDSETVMQALLDDHPESGRAWMALGQRFADQQRPHEALTAFRYAIGLLNSEYKESTEVASYLMSMGRYGSAALFLGRAWREHPGWYTAPGLLAAVELARGNPTRAAAAAGAATILEPDNPSMHHLLAQALSASGRPGPAIVARVRSLRLGYSNGSRSWLLLAEDHLKVGDTLAASAALDSALAHAETEAQRDASLEFRRAMEAGGKTSRPDRS